MTSPARLLGSLLLALGLLLALTACVPGVAASPPAAKPLVASCHVLETPEEHEAVSDSRAPVPCGSNHTSETFLVAELVGELAATASRPHLSRLRALTEQYCPVDLLRTYLGARERDSSSALGITAYFPETSAWKAGLRTIRCDVSVKDAGSEEPVKLSGSLKDVMATQESARLRRCYVGAALRKAPHGTPPEVVPCTEPHVAEDINAWVNIDASSPEETDVVDTCTPFAKEFFAPKPLPASVQVTGIIVPGTGMATLRCAVRSADAAPVKGTLLHD
ncbi:septum formation family protein [Arthrobacter sp. HLT1-20]